ncbi:MAG: S-layer homology domain-containing protein [Firmicutes bacterium]|nr:S-layer homology domain-containing protein [Bacillota bacterium]
MPMKKRTRRIFITVLVLIWTLGMFVTGRPSVMQVAEAAVPTAGAAQWVNSFTDVQPNDWFYYDVAYVNGNGLMAGTSANKFSPRMNLTRAMIVTILYREAGSPEVSGLTNHFSDVAGGTWYTDAITWAAKNGVVSGYGNGKFGPAEKVTREQLAVIIFNYAQFVNKGPVGQWAIRVDFKDIAAISDWAFEGVMFCRLQNIITGLPDGAFDPKGEATRAEAAAMLRRFIDNVIQPDNRRIIPAEYQTLSVNLFQDTWSKTEDGADLTGSAQFTAADSEFIALQGYLHDAELQPTDNAGNFTPDFSFTAGNSGQNGYDFVFTADNQLIMRNPVGLCTEVDVPASLLNGLKGFIAQIRNGQNDPGKTTAGLLKEIISCARYGLVINSPYGNQLVLDYLVNLWGDPGEDAYRDIPEAKGTYVTFPHRNVTVGMNKGMQVFEMCDTDRATIGRITFGDIKAALGQPVYDVQDGTGKRIVGYHINNDYNLEFVLTGNKERATVDHYNVLWPQGSVNIMAGDPGRQW